MRERQCIEEFERLKPRLEELWDRIFPGDEAPYTSVVVPSLTLDAAEMAKLKGAPFYEERLLFLLMRLRNPKARVVYVTSQPIHPGVIDYYLQMLAGVPASHARARLTLLCAYDSTPRPLTQKILERPRLVARIRAAIAEQPAAYLTVYNSTPLERRLAVELGIPMNAPDPHLIRYGSKTGSRLIFKEAGIPVPLGFEDLRSTNAIVAALEKIRMQKPDIRKAVLKMNEGFSGEGNAIFEYPAPHSGIPLVEALNSLRVPSASDTAAAYLTRFCKGGGIVEEFIDVAGRTSPSVQLRINPRREVILASSHEQILGGHDDQVFLGCRFPAADPYRVAIQEAAIKVGRLLAEKGVIGRLSIDFLAWPTSDGWSIAALETNLRMGGTTHPMLALRFLTGGHLDASTGMFYGIDGKAKFYRASDNVQSPNYRGLLPEDLIDILLHNRLAFNHGTGTGVLFHLIGAISQYGKFGLTAIGNSREEAEQIFERTVTVLDHETKDNTPALPQINREEAIARIRTHLLALAEPGQSICHVATKFDILCGGFRRYTDEELRTVYPSLNADAPREVQEQEANDWQLRRQAEAGTATSCDTQWQRYETCRGWDDFTNETLTRFCAELLGEELEVVGEKTIPVI